MSKVRRTVLRFGALFVVLGLALTLVSCGKKETKAELVGSFNSTTKLEYFSAYPQFTFKQLTTVVQNVKIYSDDTYQLTVTRASYSGALIFDDNGTYDANDRGNSIMTYFGTYTKTSEEGLMTVVLNTPTRIIGDLHEFTGQAQGISIDTEKWTEEASTALGGDEGSITAEEYLKANAFDETTIIVDELKSNYDYVKLVVTE